MAGRLGGGQPAYIPSPDWSRNLIDYEDAPPHAVSIFTDGTAATPNAERQPGTLSGPVQLGKNFLAPASLVRQDGWQAAIFGGRNRPNLLMVAHQLASASRSSSAALTSLVALDPGTNLDSGAEGPTERTARSREPIERDRNRFRSTNLRCP